MDSSMRLKVTGDAFFLPDPEGIVYFRGNRGSFRMQGPMIDRWIEQLIPVFDGAHSLAELTDGLPDPHRGRVFEIAATLFENGFVRDVSRDRPHRLAKPLLEKYAAQIDFLDSFGGSGAARFEDYRQAKVLAAGDGPILVSLVSALLDSGLPKFRIVSESGAETDRRRLRELAAHARLADPEVDVGEAKAVPHGIAGWEETVSSFDAVLYVSTGEDKTTFRALYEACRLREVPLLPALQIGQTGVAGPIVRSREDGCWESALRRLHRRAVERDPRLHAMSSTAEGLLANTLVFELFKMLSGVAVPALRNEIYTLDLETLESARHSFLPHPAIVGWRRAEPLEPDRLVRPSPPDAVPDAAGFVAAFSRLTSPVTGIFHAWDEGDWEQLPLSLCRVQPADPRSEGPADLLPELVCGGLTHEEARREAALSGLEAYAARATGGAERMALGAGRSPAEGVGRALHHLLRGRLGARIRTSAPAGLAAAREETAGERERFYFRSLTLMRGEPQIAAGPDVLGFPVRWVRSGETWFGAVGFTPDMARREALVLAVLAAQTEERRPPGAAAEEMLRPALQAAELEERLPDAVRRLQRQGLRLCAFDAAGEPFLQEGPAGVYGVLLREEETP